MIYDGVRDETSTVSLLSLRALASLIDRSLSRHDIRRSDR